MQEQNIIPTDAKWASVIISAPVKPDEFMAVAASYDKTLRYGAQTPFNDQLESHWEGGKWEVDATHDSIITAGNGGDKPAQAQVTLFFNGGTGKYQIEQTLAPDQQLWLDLGRLIRDRVPDKNGNTLPSDLTSGTYQFRDLTQSPGSSLFEGKVITDKTYGHAAYGCMICCGHGSGFMWIDPLGVGAGYQQTQTVGAIDNCDGNPYTYGWEYPNWWTGNTSIATASTQQINGIAAGATGDFANGRINTGDGMTYVQQCPMDNDSPQGDTNVDDFTLSGTASTFDGFQGNFTIAVTGGTATNYAWSATAPPGAGNNPSVTFNQPHNASTTTDAHWFALPNVACGASASSTYTITAAVSFNDLTSPISKSTQYTVKLPPDGGAVFDGDADVAGAPSMAPDGSGTWRVTSIGTLHRVVPTNKNILLPPSSQFYNKIDQHEQVHLNQWIQGPGHLNGDLFLPNTYMGYIVDLTGTSFEDLTNKIANAKAQFRSDQLALALGRTQQAEQEAYAVSDQIAPFYAYQNNCNSI